MVPNIGKTKSMYISTSQRNTLLPLNTLQLHDQDLQITSSDKLLGLHVDDKLNFKNHIERTLKKCNSYLYLLLRIKKFLTLHSRKLFFNAYILPHLDYCCTVWGSSTSESLNLLLKFQKRAVRISLLMPLLLNFSCS